MTRDELEKIIMNSVPKIEKGRIVALESKEHGRVPMVFFPDHKVEGWLVWMSERERDGNDVYRPVIFVNDEPSFYFDVGCEEGCEGGWELFNPDLFTV